MLDINSLHVKTWHIRNPTDFKPCREYVVVNACFESFHCHLGQTRHQNELKQFFVLQLLYLHQHRTLMLPIFTMDTSPISPILNQRQHPNHKNTHKITKYHLCQKHCLIKASTFTIVFLYHQHLWVILVNVIIYIMNNNIFMINTMACTTTITKKPAFSFVQILYPMAFLPYNSGPWPNRSAL